MKNPTIAIALLAATTLALASVQAAAEPKRSGGMGITSTGTGGSGMAATGQGSPPHMMRPGSRATKSNKAPKKRAQPYCPQGRKADGTCWGRCSQVICL